MKYDYDFCMNIARIAHAGQMRKFGQNEPYIVHPIAVADQFTDSRMKCIAILHDVIEDTSLLDQDLIDMGVPEDVVDVVLVLSRKDGEKYNDYLERVHSNRDAIQIKIKDVENNMLTAPESLVEKRYKPSLEKLYRWRDENGSR